MRSKICLLIGIGSVPRQEPCIVVEPNPDEMQKQGERALREEILNVQKFIFSIRYPASFF